ncbi:MAG: hypothetical protein L0Z07_08925 [Planctomycetes bacterium]|nr:hypothetical protein [Planctomycetota bacterium]
MIQPHKCVLGLVSKSSRFSLAFSLTLLFTSFSARAAVVDYRLTALPVPSVSDTAAIVPASQPNFAIGSSIFLEVWVQTTSTNGISSASLDVHFNASVATAIGVTHSSIFNTLINSAINNPSGIINDLSGSHLGPCTDGVAVIPNWARVAIIEFSADADGVLSIQATVTGSPTYGTALCGLGDVDPLNIGFNSMAVGVGDAVIPAASTWGLITLSLLVLSAGTIALLRNAALQKLIATVGM